MMASHAVEEFGQLIGIEALTLHPAGHCTLGSHDGIDISLDTDSSDDEGLVVSLSQGAPFVTGAQLLVALQSCDARHQTGLPRISAAARGSGSEACVIGAMRLTRSQLTGRDIATAVERLQAWQRSWRERCGRND